MTTDRWRPIASASKHATSVEAPLLLSDGKNVWLGYWEPNGDYLLGHRAGWTDGTPGDWNYQLLCCIKPTHWKPCPWPSPKPRDSTKRSSP